MTPQIILMIDLHADQLLGSGEVNVLWRWRRWWRSSCVVGGGGGEVHVLWVEEVVVVLVSTSIQRRGNAFRTGVQSVYKRRVCVCYCVLVVVVAWV